MVFHIVAVGRVRDTALRESCENYFARAKRYFKLKIVEVPDSTRGGRSSKGARSAEGTALLKQLPSRATAVALTREGEHEDSPGFADRMGRWQREARDVFFVIGGAGGLDDSVLERCSGRLSLSSWTLPHELARVVLLEQLYRAGTILKGEPYHKGPR